MPTPSHPKIYHITHVDNLPAIIGTKRLLSDAEISKSGGPSMMVGMSRIKQRRLTEIKLDECYPDDFVGEYVPFYFCPRSVMLHLIWKRNSELRYQGGQGPIVHLEADLHRAIEWAEEKSRKWAFSLSKKDFCAGILCCAAARIFAPLVESACQSKPRPISVGRRPPRSPFGPEP